MAETEPANNTNHIHTTTVSGPTTTTTTTVPAGGLAAPDGITATDGASTVNNLTRVNTSDNNSQKKEKDDQQVNVSEKNTEESTVKGEKAIVVDESMLLTGKKLALAHIGFLLSVLTFLFFVFILFLFSPTRDIDANGISRAIFCVALDQTIVATALPKLASQFNALDQLTWVVSAYFCESPLLLSLSPFSILCSTPPLSSSCFCHSAVFPVFVILSSLLYSSRDPLGKRTSWPWGLCPCCSVP
ncbi:hypothetical protein FRC18_009023 [Serendipita sp. 400]|nr:hypothetical protein FRC18_009023 [Serendipita sp. 400]